MNNIKKGFTLIELLVVIAIISLLASVALASLGSARKKAADASIQETLANIRTQAAIYATEHPTNIYGNVGGCATPGTLFVDPEMTDLINAAQALSEATVTCVASENASGFGAPGYSGPAGAWYVMAPLRATANTWWCVDSIGTSKFLSGSQSASGVCP